MANMDYCRFRNTVVDLRDCYENMDADSPEEEAARLELIKLAVKIANEYGEEVKG